MGVAGKCCAGKDLVTRWLLDNHWQEINVDRVGHQALEALREEIVREFGPGILRDDRDGVIDRTRLGRIAFSSEDRRKALEAIVHPWMRAEIRRRVEQFRAAPPSDRWNRQGDAPATNDSATDAPVAGAPATDAPAAGAPATDAVRAGENGAVRPRGLVINAALLFYMELDVLCDAVILVRAPVVSRVVRAIRRDGLDLRRVILRLWSQRGLETQAHRSPADIITVDNRGTPEALRRRLQGVPQLRQEPGERTEYGAE